MAVRGDQQWKLDLVRRGMAMEEDRSQIYLGANPAGPWNFSPFRMYDPVASGEDIQILGDHIHSFYLLVKAGTSQTAVLDPPKTLWTHATLPDPVTSLSLHQPNSPPSGRTTRACFRGGICTHDLSCIQPRLCFWPTRHSDLLPLDTWPRTIVAKGQRSRGTTHRRCGLERAEGICCHHYTCSVFRQ